MVVMAHPIKDCEDSVCKRCKPNLDNHDPARCPRKMPPTSSNGQTPLTTTTPLGISLTVTMSQIFNSPFLQVNQTILLYS